MRRLSSSFSRSLGHARWPIRLAGLLVFALLIGPSLSATAQEEAAATFHGNVARTGEQPGPNPRGQAALRWRFQTEGAIRSSPVISDGLVYFGSNDGRVYAIDAENGEPRWSFTTGGAVRSTPAVADGLVVFGSDDGYVYSVSADKGELQWRFLVGMTELTGATISSEHLPRRTVTSSPLIVEGIVYIGSNNFELHAIDLATGVQRWHTPLRGPTISSPSYLDGLVFVGSEAGVYALDAETGHIVWAAVWGLEKPAEEEEDDADDDGDGTANENDDDDDGDGLPDDQDTVNDADDGVADDGSQNQEEEEEDNSLAADLKDGSLTVSELMATEQGDFTWNVVGSPVPVGNLVYAVGFEESTQRLAGTDQPALVIGTLLQLDIASGEVTGLWYFTAWDDILTTPAVVDDAIYFGTDRGLIYAVEAEIFSAALVEQSAESDEASELSFAANQQRWGVQTEQYVLGSASVAGEIVYAGNAGGVLYALDTKTGNERWQFATDGPIWSSPAVVDGVVYVGSDDGFLYALGNA